MTFPILRRLGASAFLCWALLTAVFFIAHLAPGDPVRSAISPRMSAEAVEGLRRTFGLDRPLREQYAAWLTDALTGDWGVSFVQHRPVLAILREAIPNTIILAVPAVVLEFVLGGALGWYLFSKRNTGPERWLVSGTTAIYAVPSFVVGTLLVASLSYGLGLLPSSRMYDSAGPGELGDLARHILLPALTIAIPGAAAIAGYFRAGLLDAAAADHVLFARSLGIPRSRIALRFLAPNAAVSLITFAGLELGALLTGTVVTESLFAWPGVGRLTVQAVLSRDYPLIMGCACVAGVGVILANLLADVIHLIVDPRLRRLSASEQAGGAL